MREIKEFINEKLNKLDIELSELITHLSNTNKPGNLKYSGMDWTEGFEVSLKSNEKFKNVIENGSSADFGDNFDDIIKNYLDENDIKKIINIDSFEEYCKDYAYDLINLEFDDTNRFIRCERSITLSETKYKSLGIYWAWNLGKSEAHWGNYKNKLIVYEALVDPKSVDWPNTIISNLSLPEEYELTLKENESIQLIKIKHNNEIIWKGNLICKA